MPKTHLEGRDLQIHTSLLSQKVIPPKHFNTCKCILEQSFKIFLLNIVAKIFEGEKLAFGGISQVPPI